MSEEVQCERHKEIYEIYGKYYISKRDSTKVYNGLLIGHMGTDVYVTVRFKIDYCPWCGKKLEKD